MPTFRIFGDPTDDIEFDSDAESVFGGHNDQQSHDRFRQYGLGQSLGSSSWFSSRSHQTIGDQSPEHADGSRGVRGRLRSLLSTPLSTTRRAPTSSHSLNLDSDMPLLRPYRRHGQRNRDSNLNDANVRDWDLRDPNVPHSTHEERLRYWSYDLLNEHELRLELEQSRADLAELRSRRSRREDSRPAAASDRRIFATPRSESYYDREYIRVEDVERDVGWQGITSPMGRNTGTGTASEQVEDTDHNGQTTVHPTDLPYFQRLRFIRRRVDEVEDSLTLADLDLLRQLQASIRERAEVELRSRGLIDLLGSLEDVRRVPGGLPIDSSQFTVPATNAGAEDSCAICLEGSSDGELRKPQICEHIFHKDCLDSWANSTNKNSNKCPMCRKEMCSRRQIRPDIPQADRY